MAKIGSANIELLRPEFEESNKLLTEGLKGMWESGDPLKTAIDGNINYLQEERVGQLKNMLQGILPQDPSDPMAMQQYMQQATDMAQDNGFNKWGINAGGATNLADNLVDRNQKIQTTQGTNERTQIDNKNLADTRALNEIVNRETAKGGGANDIMKEVSKAGIGVNAPNDLYKTAGLKGAVANSQVDRLIQMASTLGGMDAIVARMNGNMDYTSAEQKMADQNFIASWEALQRAGSSGGVNSVGKGQGSTQSGYQTTNGVPPSVSQYTPLISRYASEEGLPEGLISSMMFRESSGNNNAVSPKGASGLMQLMPETGAEVAKKLGLPNTSTPENNIRAGTAYMGQMVKQFDGNIAHALMAYNWGPGNTQEWLDGGKKGKVPQETLNYVRNVASSWKQSAQQQRDNAAPNTISYDKGITTRKDPLSSKLSNTMNNVLHPMGVTMKVYSGGQKPGKGMGSDRHDHGNAADADFFIDGGKTKLSFNNPEHRQILSKIIEESAASGLGGIGGGQDYMGDGRLHIGFGSSATWGGKEGKGSAPDWIKQAHSRGVARYNATGGKATLGEGNGGGGVDISPFAALLGRTDMNGATRENLSHLSGLATESINNTNNLLGSIEQVDYDSTAFPESMNRGGISIMDEINTKAAPLLKYIQGETDLEVDAINSSTEAAVADMGAAGDVIRKNSEVLNAYDRAQQTAIENMQANGNSSSEIPLIAIFGNDEGKMKEGLNLLKSNGITKEVLNQYDGQTQKTIMNAVMEYMDLGDNNAAKNNIKVDALKAGSVGGSVIGTDSKSKQAKDVIVNAATNLLDEGSLATFGNWQENKKGFTRSSTIIDRQDNLKAVHKEMSNMVVNTYSEEYSKNPDKWGILTKADLVQITTDAKKEYAAQMKASGQIDSKDLTGKKDTLHNLGKYNAAVYKHLNKQLRKRNTAINKASQETAQLPFSLYLEQALNKNARNLLGQNPEK